ncbi:MAG: cytochrome c oxidase subunit II [Meiothermus sp.]|uniref:cytochrome c oxidase subunit II n=1 Tax=Meiothermus sp. TaxID=1955249 RepID=UPI00261D2815|nr:cytochrome c oxidase subunit II [Meiothermus sp.]MCS7059241.1 cytochrome c oxidase subunit II [Meiothermus sp.]
MLTLQRSLGLLILLVAGLVLGAEPGQAGGHTLNIIDPQASAFNREVRGLLVWVMGFAALVFVVVVGALTYVVIKFRRTGKETAEPEQVHGNDRLEVIWTVIPTVIVLIIFGLTAQSMFRLDRPTPGAMVVEVRGWQFWWDFIYKDHGVRTSNELILPVGRPVRFEVTGGDGQNYDVIHSFRITSMVGARDAIPGVVTHIEVTPEKVGIYYGQCVELCGASHANMRFRVVVVPEEEFDRWIEEAKAYQATPPTDPVLARGEQLYKQQCAACHSLKGVSQGLPQNPDLTFFGNRITVGAGMWPNTPEYLERWIRNSPGMKPGIKMPAFPQLSDEDTKAIAAYLMSHKVEGLDFSNLEKF